ncbi:hypothetical protein ABZW30_45485 [Kitasatospora sp. NPDC004669]|uniref:hypothetical protein n=1 Tax=Kitasatospora sp. NPDC004669 TaxID=3154555 RepID=UPI0033A65503
MGWPATEDHWRGQRWEDEGVTFDGKIPVLGTTMDRLRRHSFLGPIWWRFGRSQWQTVTDALNDTPDWDLIHQRRVQIAENASFLRTVFGPRKPKEPKERRA